MPVVQLAALFQVALHVASATPAAPAPPVRVWLADTVVGIGASGGGRVFVNVREPGHLLVLHVDPAGRVRVLFPTHPNDDDAVPGGATFEVAGADGRAAVRVAAAGAGTLLAARSNRPFDFTGLRAPESGGTEWDYAGGMLFQPTAGDPLAALLDIADRVTAGHPYQFDVAAYRTPGAVAARYQSPSDVCLGCVRQGYTAAPEGEGEDGAGSTTVNYVASPSQGGAMVDCSSANLVESFCGVIDNRVTNTTYYQSTESQPYPVYVPFAFPRQRRRFRTPAAPAAPRAAIALTLRRTSMPVIPPQQRAPRLLPVHQPVAPSRPRFVADDASSPGDRRDTPAQPASGGRRSVSGGSSVANDPAPNAARADQPRFVQQEMMEAPQPTVRERRLFGEGSSRRHAEPAPVTSRSEGRGLALPAAPARVVVPSRALLRTMQSRRP